MTRRAWALCAAAAVGAVACGEVTPTSLDETLLPEEPVSVEVRLGWSSFAADLEVVGGYGTAQELGTGVAARAFAGTLDARTLVRFSTFPRSTSLPDSTGTTRVDSMLTVLGGRVVARFDTLASRSDGPVTLALGSLDQAWHARTATWDLAVDTIRDRAPWTEPGAGPVVPLATAVWDPALGDSAVFDLDSAQLAVWADTASTVSRSVRIDAVSEGARLKVDGVALRLDVRPSINQDTTVVLTTGRQALTFVYSPFPEPPPDGIRIGGVPAWRTVLDLNLPARLDGPASLCAAVGCPADLTADRVTYAALVLRSKRGDPAFQPTDTIGLDVRPVLLRSALPKAPLGSSLIGPVGRRVGPALFGEAEGTEIEIPITGFVRALLAPDTASAASQPRTLALLSTFEPVSITFASFHGPGSPDEPVLKLIVTAGRSVELP